LRLGHITIAIELVVRSTSQSVDGLREMVLLVTLADRPEYIRVNTVPEGKTVTFWVYSHPKDAAKLIGLNGRMARALRLVLQANAMKLQIRLTLNICSGEGDQLENSSAAD
jgi:predicted RNA-binding protein YlqC (UPF0109 family)